MKKKYSLKGRLCFRSVFLEGKKFKRRYCIFYVLESCKKKNSLTCNKSDKTLKLGIIVTKRMGNAYLRNRAKRKFRAAFQLEAETYSSDLCLVAKLRNDFNKIKLDAIREDIALFLQDVGINKR